MEAARLPIILEEHSANGSDLEEGLIHKESENLCECCNGPWCVYVVPCVIGWNVVLCTGLIIFVILGYILGDKLIH
jgi:hypothetical protein